MDGEATTMDAAGFPAPSEEEEEEQEPTIPFSIALFIGSFVLVLDLIDLIPTAGWITDAFSLPINFYLLSIGVSGLWFLFAQGADMLPLVQELPWRTVAWIVIVIRDHVSPLKKATAGLEKAGEIGQQVEGVSGGVKAAEGAAKGGAATTEGGARVTANAEGVPTEPAPVEAGTAGGAAPEQSVETTGAPAAEETGAPAPAEEGQGQIEAEETAKKEGDYERMMEAEAERPIIGEEGLLQEQYFEQTPQGTPQAVTEQPAEPPRPGASGEETQAERTRRGLAEAQKWRDRLAGGQPSDEENDDTGANDDGNGES